ncbi:hypothetical protein BHE74_00057794 [Ensete ventricosum]|nr:hypothetical protein BHE74_00057794 [Ensete ventricosum]
MGVFSVKRGVVGCATRSSVTSQLLTDVDDVRHAVLDGNGLLRCKLYIDRIDTIGVVDGFKMATQFLWLIKYSGDLDGPLPCHFMDINKKAVQSTFLLHLATATADDVVIWGFQCRLTKEPKVTHPSQSGVCIPRIKMVCSPPWRNTMDLIT